MVSEQHNHDLDQGSDASGSIAGFITRGYMPLLVVVLLLICGSLATALAVNFTWQSERDGASEQFRSDVRSQLAALQFQLSRHDFRLRAFADFLSADPQLDYQTFDRYARAVMRDEPSVQAMEWVPRVRHDQRAAFEARWAEVFEGFEITDQAEDGEIVRAPVGEEYWPILYVSPLEGNEPVVGYSPASLPARDIAIERALQFNEPSLSPFFPLLQGGLGAVAFHPVRDSGGRLLGLAEVVYRRDNLVSDESFVLGDAGVRVRITTATDGVVIFDATGSRPAPLAWNQWPLEREHTNRLDVGGQAWLVSIESLPGGYAYSWLVPASIGLAGTLSTLLLCGFVLMLVRRERVVSEMVEQRSQALIFQSHHDALTGLINRRSFESLIQDSIQSRMGAGSDQAVFLIDLDQFKVINDTVGHRVGDRFLAAVAARLQTRFSQSAHLARLGGDEFGLLHNRCDVVQAERLANEILALIGETEFQGANGALRTTASIGIAMIESGNESAQSVMASADAACFLAKERGRGRYHLFHGGDEEGQQYRAEMSWVAEIREAIEEDRLLLRAQRIVPVDGSAQQADFHEALVSLKRRDGEIVPPGAFLPAAERYQMMPHLDRWVLEHVLEWMAAEDDNSRWSVNLSGQSLNGEDLGDWVIDAICRHSVEPRRLCLEITETAVVSNLALARRFIERLHAVGCRFALDDFGSGMSSFTYLKHLPVDFIKIDGSFVRDITNDPSDRTTVAAIHNIARSHGIATIAEFVETREVIDCLDEIGIDYMQGYYIGRPFFLKAAAPSEA